MTNVKTSQTVVVTIGVEEFLKRLNLDGYAADHDLDSVRVLCGHDGFDTPLSQVVEIQLESVTEERLGRDV